MKKVKIFDVAFDAVEKDEAIQRILEALERNHKVYAVTPNPEMLLESIKNHAFRQILNNAFLSIPDGIGILWATTFLEKTKRNKSRLIILLKGFWYLLSLLFRPSLCRKIFPERVTGTDVMIALCRKIPRQKRIFLLGAETGIADKTAKILQSTCNIVGVDSGFPHEIHDKNSRKIINESKADLLFVAFGAPKQELWIARNLPHLHTVKVAIGVGGAFDFIAGEKKRAPKWMQKIGIEWLFRVIQEPSRLKRIFNATVKFPYLVIKFRLKQ